MNKDEVIDAIAKRMVVNRWDSETWETGLTGMKPGEVEQWRNNWRKEAAGLLGIVTPLFNEAITAADTQRQQMDQIFQAATRLMNECANGHVSDFYVDDPIGREALHQVETRIFSEILVHQPSEIPLEIFAEDEDAPF